jgi:hypothetical protein
MKGFAPTIESPQVDIVEAGQTVELPLSVPRPQTSACGLQARAPPV